MYAIELRIGNLIYNGLKEILEVDANTIRDFNIGNSILGGFKPIPLTEEILLKAGFKNDAGSGNYYIGEFVGVYFTFTEKSNKFNVSSDYDATVYISLPKYVHQLQNLYFALTGQELEINL